MSKQILRIVNFGASNAGLSTVGYTIYDKNRSVVSARTISGVGEVGTSTGVYSAIVNMPDDDSIVLWDTGGASPRYSTEDYQSQFNKIQEETDHIRLIWNSIKNQGNFYSLLVDKVDKLKNIIKGLADIVMNIDKKSIPRIEDIKKALSVTVSAPEVNVPLGKDYDEVLTKISAGLEIVMSKLESIKNQKDYAGNFSSLISLLQETQRRVDFAVRTSSGSIRREVKALQSVFVKIEDVLSRISEVKSTLGKKEETQSILKEIGKLNEYIKRLGMSKEDLTILQSFGHRFK